MPVSAQTGAAAVPPSGPPPTVTSPVIVTTPAPAPTSAEVAHQTSHERRKLALAARQSVIDGEKLLSIYSYDDAADRFQYALDALVPGGDSAALYSRAEYDLALAKEGQAHQLAAASKFAQAASRVQEAIALEPGDPRFQADLAALKDQQEAYEEQVHNVEGTVGNPAVTQDFRDKVAAVQKLLFEGDAYFRTGQYTQAEETFSKVLILDPYNKAARDAMGHMERYRYRAANLRREEYKDEKMLEVDQGWAEAISPDIVAPPTTPTTISEPSNRAAITDKLQSIIIDKIDFDKLDVSRVVQYLNQKSKELDPQHVGINFVLNLNQETPPPAPAGSPGASTAPAPAPAAPAANGGFGATNTAGGFGAAGTTGGFGAAGAGAGAGAGGFGATTTAAGAGAGGFGAGASSGGFGSAPAAAPAPAAPAAASDETTGPIHRQVTIQLENVPLSDVLGYILQQTNLQYSVDDYAVYLRPSIDQGQTLSVRTFLAPPNFFTNSGGLSVEAGTAPDQPLQVTNVSTDVEGELKNRGIRFPPGATAVFLPGSSKLVVRNTPEELDLIANLLEQLSKETPQVQIEAKLAEFTDTALKSLSFNYIVGYRGLLNGNQTLGQTGGFVAATGLRDANFNTGGATTGGAPTGGLSPNSIDSLIEQNQATNSGITRATFGLTGLPVLPNTPNQLTVGAIIDGIGFEAVIEALNNHTGVDLISAPTVTTQDQLKANIDIVREFPYPTSFERPRLSNSEISYSSGKFGPQLALQIASNNGLTAAGITEIIYPLELAIPPTPREFVTQDIGVSLEVKPTTYPDQRIDLDITKAQVVDFDGFIDYGVPIVTKLAEENPVTVLTPGTINQPVFNIRSMVTRLQILDGQTAVLGGLLREDTQEIRDKVPILGDLPLLGRLFQSRVSERIKKNLLIFITARLIKSNGKPEYVQTLEAEPDAEEALPEPASINTGQPLPPPPAEPNS